MDFEGKLYDDGYSLKYSSGEQTESMELDFIGKNPRYVNYDKASGNYYYSNWAIPVTYSDFIASCNFKKCITANTWEFPESKTIEGIDYDYHKCSTVSDVTFPIFLLSSIT